MIVDDSLAEVNTTPTDDRNQPTLLTIHVVNVLKNPPTTVEVTTCVTQLSGWNRHSR